MKRTAKKARAKKVSRTCDDTVPEYDFSNGVRNKYAARKMKLPRKWDEARLKAVLKYYEQSGRRKAAKNQGAANATTSVVMDVPVDLVPKVRELIAKRRAR